MFFLFFSHVSQNAFASEHQSQVEPMWHEMGKYVSYTTEMKVTKSFRHGLIQVHTRYNWGTASSFLGNIFVPKWWQKVLQDFLGVKSFLPYQLREAEKEWLASLMPGKSFRDACDRPT